MGELIHKLLDRVFSKRVIVNCDRDPYLHRWFVIRRDAFAVFIHKFVRSDEDRALHDHPWGFIVIPLWRGYIEHSERWIDDEHSLGGGFWVTATRRVYPIFGIRKRPATYRHRVELFRQWVPDWDGGIPGGHNTELPSWSLFIRFRKWREWGFWEKTGFIRWDAWWKEKCE